MYKTPASLFLFHLKIYMLFPPLQRAKVQNQDGIQVYICIKLSTLPDHELRGKREKLKIKKQLPGYKNMVLWLSLLSLSHSLSLFYVDID